MYENKNIYNQVNLYLQKDFFNLITYIYFLKW